MNTIRELAAALASGRISSLALVEQMLARIDAHIGDGGAAYVSIDRAQALADARSSDGARAAGLAASPLAGVPLSVKDLFDVRGQVSAAASLVLGHAAPAAQDAPVVARLRAAGAVLLGRSNMSEFAFSGLGLNPHFGTPLNPHDGSRVAGGSTSGGALTVALDMAAGALGTDTGGSLRIPAAFCGLTGFKPTAATVPLDAAVPLSTSLDSAGPIGRSVDCCAILYSVLSATPLAQAAAPALAGLRFGVSRDYVGAGLDDSVRRNFARALHRLREAGATVEEFAFPELLELPAINGGGGLVAAEAWAWHRKLLERQGARYDQRVAARIRRGAQQSAADYIDLLDARRRMIATARQRLAGFDAWLMPSVAIVAPPLAPLEADDAAFFATNGLVLRNTSVINFLDGCALSLPCQAPGELPVGLGICGLAGQDQHILAIGRALEALF
ncbi:amidase [Janthinobacterium agaricidamnosum]|uniref:Amidase family protein n=1 Tax=Janthinobacterium agaricidamnosum NBRC 102515 = DSM 9628 TaxID=1349767 RepID=W0VBL1_9BURK|nr:amidase [Janthinobacterium agaricidamnosum]CDG84990.1 amidase family protein [Janthinobacterium agaricidamnosum NBRC 102515 = DSM 9628]